MNMLRELHKEFMGAIYNGDLKKVSDMLDSESKPVNVNYHFGDGWSILERAEYHRGSADVVDFLASKGAVIDQSTPAQDSSHQDVRDRLSKKLFGNLPKIGVN